MNSQLAVYEYKEEFIQLLDSNQTVILMSATGSGKTTQIPQWCTEYVKNTSKQGERMTVGCTQPRRVAAMSVAARVAEEMDVKLGEEVGYKFRFENVTTDQTRLIYLTDGMLLKEYANDKSLKKYACIILDEIHERSVASDILMSCLRQVQIERNETRRKLKLVLMSATMEVEPLKKFFNAPAYYIPGRTHSVEIFYCNKISLKQNDHTDNAIQTVIQLHKSEPIANAFLVFLTGQNDIEVVCKALWQKFGSSKEVRVYPFYAQRRAEEFNDIFAIDTNSRKIIVATNIAETSITIPDIRVVIDSGKAKQKFYVHERRFSVLEVRPISQAQAIQRAGRAGRCEDGKCYRLYSKSSYEQLEKQTTPEILRTSLSEVLFSLFSANITNPKRCKFLDNPADDEWCAALDELIALELIQAHRDSTTYGISDYFNLDNDEKLGLNFALTEMGEKVKMLPLSPMLARFLYLASKYKCSFEAVTIAAFCSVEDFVAPFESMDAETKEEHDRFMRTFNTPEGDHLRLVQIFQVYKKHGSKNVRHNWCKQTGLNPKRMEEVFEVRKQLRSACEEAGIFTEGTPHSESNKQGLKRSLVESFYLNVCWYSMKDNCYRMPNGQDQIYVHPSSLLNRQYPTTVIYTELIRTQKLYMRMVTPIDRADVEKRLKDLRIHFKSFKRDSTDNPPQQRRGSFAHLNNF